MRTLSAGPAIRFAFRFAFGQTGTIIGLIWAPMVAIAMLALLPRVLGYGGETMPQPGGAIAGAAMLRDLVFWVTDMVLWSCVYAAVTRQALGLRSGPAVFHFQVGLTELRVTGVTMLLQLIALVLMTATVLAMVAAVLAAGASKPAAVTAVAAVGIAGGCGLLYVLTQLGFLLVPVTVAEQRLSLARSWTLAGGNFWRITTVLFAVTLPPLLILLGVVLLVTGRELWALATVLDKLTPEILSERLETIFEAHMPTIIGTEFLIAPFAIGLFLGAAAYAYKELASASMLKR